MSKGIFFQFLHYFCFSMILSFLLTSCGSLSDYELRSDPSGLVRTHYKEESQTNTEDIALRDGEGKVISDMDQGKRVFSQLEGVSDIRKMKKDIDCSWIKNHQFSIHYWKALEFFQKGELQMANDEVTLAIKSCPGKKMSSDIHYLLAAIADKQNQPSLAKSHLQEFLNYSSSIFPWDLHQFDYYLQFDQKSREILRADFEEALAKKRMWATQYLDDKRQDLPVPENPFQHISKGLRLPVSNNFLPGQEDKLFTFVFPLFEYNIFDTGLGFFFTTYSNFLKLRITPSIMYYDHAGTVWGLKIRKQLYESFDRTLAHGISARINQWKTRFYRYSFSGASSSYPTGSGYNYYVGYGGTWRARYRPYLGMVGNFEIGNNTAAKVYEGIGTLFGFYDFYPGFALQGGLMDNHLSLATMVGPFQIGYDFKLDSVFAKLHF